MAVSPEPSSGLADFPAGSPVQVLGAERKRHDGGRLSAGQQLLSHANLPPDQPETNSPVLQAQGRAYTPDLALALVYAAPRQWLRPAPTQAAELAVRVTPEVQPRDSLLAGLTPLRIGDAADLIVAYLLR